MQSVASVINYLQQEIDLVQSINVLLSEERKLLITRQFHALEAISDEKISLSNRLETSAKQRIAFMDPTGMHVEPKQSFNTFLQQCSDEETIAINTHNTILADKLNLCRELNMINGQVIATNVYTREVLANTLTGNNPDALNIYTATGNVKSSSSNGLYQAV